MLFASSGSRIMPRDQDVFGLFLSIGNIGFPSLDVYGVERNVAANQTINASNASIATIYVENTDANLSVLPWSGLMSTQGQPLRNPSSLGYYPPWIYSAVILLCAWVAYKEYIRNETLAAKGRVTPSIMLFMSADCQRMRQRTKY